ncbi:hypothetical protein DFH08DRAFT_988532 [Mycena albidolilacea]|uniref:Uncharacterized protein n=1 Tax=Mycena albidolilacea TaxID=1033008 RepID=A0AAD6Z0Q7_9AGAR|nr:hypothetical protein DFH08DRAFT_988532 [Mycena albidolilacea]
MSNLISAKSIFLVFGCPGLLWYVYAHPPTPTLTMDSVYLPSTPACARTLIPVFCTPDDDKSTCSRALHCITRWFVPPLSMLPLRAHRPSRSLRSHSILDAHSPLLVLQSTRLKFRPWLPPHSSIQREFEGRSWPTDPPAPSPVLSPAD